jgi:hypothetical protein
LEKIGFVCLVNSLKNRLQCYETQRKNRDENLREIIDLRELRENDKKLAQIINVGLIQDD